MNEYAELVDDVEAERAAMLEEFEQTRRDACEHITREFDRMLAETKTPTVRADIERSRQRALELLDSFLNSKIAGSLVVLERLHEGTELH